MTAEESLPLASVYLVFTDTWAHHDFPIVFSCATSCLSALYFLGEMNPAVWLALVFLSLWDLASTGFLIGFSVFCTDYGQYRFSNILRISRVLVFL